jgi:hypothetical protein
MTTHAHTIAEVIDGLDEIIASAHARKSRIGYFACLYRLVTEAVKRGSEQGKFDDPARMERVDVAFANRYFDAIDQHLRGEPATRSWQVAFDAAAQWQPIVLQHLLIAMNAHINLDLGIAVARAFPGSGGHLQAFRDDFQRMNAVLASLVLTVEDELENIWPVLRVVHSLLRGEDDAVMSFSMKEARGLAWDTAQKLAPLSHAEQEAEIDNLDRIVAELGHLVWKPSFPLNLPVILLRALQREKSVPSVIDILLDPRFRRALHHRLAHDPHLGIDLLNV